MNIEPLNLEKQYDFYLDQCGIAKDKMHPVQKSETKKAFFGGAAQVLHLMNTHVSQMDEGNAVLAIKYLEDQAAVFWANELKNKPKEILIPKENKIINLHGEAATKDHI